MAFYDWPCVGRGVVSSNGVVKQMGNIPFNYTGPRKIPLV